MSDRRAHWPQPLLGLGTGTLLVACWLNPTHYLPWASFYSELPAGAAAMILALAAVGTFRRLPIRMPKTAFALLIVATIPALQWALGQVTYLGDAILAIVYLAGAAACFAIGATSASDHDPKTLTEVLAWAILVGALASTAIALQQWFGQADWSEWIVPGLPGARADANLRQANHFATLLLWGMLAAAYLRTLGHLTGGTLSLAAAFLALGLALSQSRTVWLALVVFAVWTTARRKALWSPLALRATYLAGLGSLYALLFWAVLALPATLRLDSGGGLLDRLEVGGRPLIWSQMLEAVRLSPWLGYGWLQGQAAQAASAIATPGLEFTTYAHNLLLDLIVWNGLPIGLLLGGLLIWWYVRLGLRAEGAADSFRFGVVTVFAVHSMLEYPFAYAYFLIPVALLAGQLEVRSASIVLPSRLAAAQRPAFVLCALACAVLVVAIARDYVLAEADRREVQMVMVRIGGDRPFPPVPDLWVLDQLRAATRAARIDVGPNLLPGELEELLKITHRYQSAFFLRTSAAALALNGREDEALTELHRLRGLHGERQYRAAVNWMHETATTKSWPMAGFLAKVAKAQ